MIKFNNDAAEYILETTEELYKGVSMTAGPLGYDYLFDTPWGRATTHDGATVAQDISRTQGGNLIAAAALSTESNVGDGTTTATILAYHLLNEAIKLGRAGFNVPQIKRQMEAASKVILTKLDDISEPSKDLKSIATISAADPHLGEIIAKVIEVVGHDGAVSVEETSDLTTSYQIVEGYTFARGFISPAMVTEGKKAVYTKPNILITDQKIYTMTDLLPLIDHLAKNNQNNLVIICEDLSDDALSQINLNNAKGSFKVLAVKAPFLGEERTQYLFDMAALTGAIMIEAGTYSITGTSPEVLGRAETVISTRDQTTIIDGGGDREMISQRIAELKAEDELARATALDLKVAVIRVGGATEGETIERKDRVDDAVAATKAAAIGGIVPGGGVTPIYLASFLKEDDLGTKVLRHALLQPFRVLTVNAGLNPDELIPLVQKAKFGMGYDLFDATKLIDLKKAGIIDPAWVTREAIRNAVSVAGTAMKIGAASIKDKE